MNHNIERIFCQRIVDRSSSREKRKIDILARVLRIVEQSGPQGRLRDLLKRNDIIVTLERCQESQIALKQESLVAPDEKLLLLTRQVQQLEFEFGLELPVFLQYDLGQVSAFFDDICVAILALHHGWKDALRVDAIIFVDSVKLPVLFRRVFSLLAAKYVAFLQVNELAISGACEIGGELNDLQGLRYQAEHVVSLFCDLVDEHLFLEMDGSADLLKFNLRHGVVVPRFAFRLHLRCYSCVKGGKILWRRWLGDPLPQKTLAR